MAPQARDEGQLSKVNLFEPDPVQQPQPVVSDFNITKQPATNLPIVPDIGNIVNQGAAGTLSSQATPPPVTPPTSTTMDDLSLGMLPPVMPQSQSKNITTEQTTTVKGIPLSKATIAAQTEAEKKQAEAIVAAEEAGKLRVIEEEAAAKAREKIIQTQIEEDKKRQERMDTSYNTLVGERDKLIEDASKAKVDPQKLFRDKGTFAQIGAAIAVGLGAYAASINKGPNYAMQIIDSAIDRDIDAQKQEIAQKWRGVEQKTNALNELTRKFGDERIAASALKEQQLASLQFNLDSKLSLVKNAEQKAKIAEMKGSLAQRQLEQKLQTEQLTKDKVQSTVTTQAAQTDTIGVNKQNRELQNDWMSDARVKTAQEKEMFRNRVAELMPEVRKGNSQAINELRGAVAKAAQGTGVLSDNDMKIFGLERGPGESIADAINKFLGRGMTEAQLKYADALIPRIDKEVTRNYADAYKDRKDLWLSSGVDPRIVIGQDKFNRIFGSKSKEAKKAQEGPTGFKPVGK